MKDPWGNREYSATGGSGTKNLLLYVVEEWGVYSLGQKICLGTTVKGITYQKCVANSRVKCEMGIGLKDHPDKRIVLGYGNKMIQWNILKIMAQGYNYISIFLGLIHYRVKAMHSNDDKKEHCGGDW